MASHITASLKSEGNFNPILDIIGNNTRRKILSTLSREPMYFNQLAKEIGIGQQAILRHVNALEDIGLKRVIWELLIESITDLTLRLV